MRAMPETEIPPAMRVDYYLWNIHSCDKPALALSS
jgi:hypothetical protein